MGDINVEHLLDVFIAIDESLNDVWEACCNFMQHLFWGKPRLTVLKSRIEGLSDDHEPKPSCLFDLALLFREVGNLVECKRLLTDAGGMPKHTRFLVLSQKSA